MEMLVRKIHRVPKVSNVETLVEELVAKATKVKTNKETVKHGAVYVFLVYVKWPLTYGDQVLDDDDFALIWPTDPGDYYEMITASTNEVTRAQKQAKNVRKIKEFEKYLGVEEALKVLILSNFTSRSLRVATIKATLTISLNTTLIYVIIVIAI